MLIFAVFYLLIAIFWDEVGGQLRLCEADGSCRHCADNRYSYYRCRMLDDCFIGEVCDNGFCCPNMPPTFSLQRENTKNVSRSDPTTEDPCPDGSVWERRCKKDEDCTHLEESCTEGKCCKTCAMRRRQLLDELRNVEIVGQSIPQCEENGISYRRRQCLAGTDICWCVSTNGRRLSRKEYRDERECETVRRKQENLAMKAAALLNDDKTEVEKCSSYAGQCPSVKSASSVLLASLPRCICDSDCLSGKKCCPIFANETANVCLPILTQKTNPLSPTMSLVCGANEQYTACYSSCQPSCQDPTTPSCPAPECQPGCVCLPGYIRRDGSPRSACVPRALCQAYDLTIRCADDRRQYHTCGSACPISCETRNHPRCTEKCVTGCFCKVPYILENAADPLHSRCVLPSECAVESMPMPSAMVEQYVQRNPQLSGGFGNLQYPTTPWTMSTTTPVPPAIAPISAKVVQPTLIPNTENHCADPLKNYLSCGSKCPASCDRPLTQATSLECALSCVSGCFCRLPYVLLNSADSTSACILPQLCPRNTTPQSISSSASVAESAVISSTKCSDPRKEWTECGALQCARSCANPLGRCAAGQCTSGCVCREPYVLLHPNDPTSRCVLPAECERSCEDPAKEFITCGSSCPMGCDNRHPKNCAPCQTGCFCINGLVFENSRAWHTSKCIKIEECPIEESSTTPVTTTTTTIETTTETVTTVIAKHHDDGDLLKSDSDTCPQTTSDVGGRGCNSDIDCPVEQRCCRPLIVSLGVSPQRCVCPDKNAVWSSCGTLCPEYCGQPSVPVCSSTCNAGCHCAPGYIRSRNDVNAPCVRRDSCPIGTRILPAAAASLDDGTRRATITEIHTNDPDFYYDVIAVAILTARDGSTIGRFTFSQITSTTMKVHGEVFSLPPGRHAVVVHQFGDASEGCSRVGAPFSRTQNRSPSLGDITEIGSIDRVIDWPVSDVVGRALVIYPFSTAAWLQTTHFGEKPIACGTIGIAKIA